MSCDDTQPHTEKVTARSRLAHCLPEANSPFDEDRGFRQEKEGLLRLAVLPLWQLPD